MSERKSNDVFRNDVLQQHASRIQELSQEPPASGIQSETVSSMLARDFGIQIPNETVPLPSEGKVYSPNHPLHMCSTVDIKTMTAREEDILMNQAYLKKGTVLTELLRSCLIDKRVNPADLIMGDRNALMVAIRITGYGHLYAADVTCSECGERTETEFDLSTLPIKNLELDPALPGHNLFEFKLPKTGANVQFQFLTGRVEEEIMVTQERQKKANVGGGNNVTLQLQHAIVSVNGVTDRAKLANFVSTMHAYDSLTLRNYIKENEPGILMRQERVCPKCDNVEEVTIPMGISFLWPNARK